MAYTSIMFSHSGSVSRDSELDKAFMALNISMTTRMLRDIVEAVFEWSLAKISQPISGKEEEQVWKLHWVHLC